MSYIPTIKPRKRKKRFYQDETLAALCKRNKMIWRDWHDAGRPRTGPLYNDLRQAKRNIRSHLQHCRANDERKQIRVRDHMVRTNHPDRFYLPRRKMSCRKLFVNGTTFTDSEDLLKCWHDHFQTLGQSTQCGRTDNNIIDTDLLFNSSLANKDGVLDDEFTIEEVERAVHSLKNGKSSGADGLSAEHLKFGGPSIPCWLKRIFNSIIKLEAIPPTLNRGLITPVFKGKGCDPLDPNNYRGITVTSVISKCFERSILQRLLPILEEQGFPHPAQTAYTKGRSCADGIFSTTEVLRVLLQDGDSPYLCLYDLQKAFDSVEYNVLLHHLYTFGIHGKTWRIIHSWYSNSTCAVRLQHQTSSIFTVQRGVKQGSVLSPILFCMVMDKLLHTMCGGPHDLTLTGLSVGCSAHADDIRTCCIGVDNINKQANDINMFVSASSLALNTAKTEIVHLSRHALPQESIDVIDKTVTTKKEAKCLGVWWSQDLSSNKSVEENINKARRAFFALGAIEVFQGKCNPLTARSLFTTFVMPILLYGCESWFITEPIATMLDRFQAEVGKRILRLPRSHNNLTVCVGLKWPSFLMTILMRKLAFLAKLLSNKTDSNSRRIFQTLVSKGDITNISLVQQCRELEMKFGTNILEQCLEAPADATYTVRKAKSHLLEADWKRTVSAAIIHSSLTHICSPQLVDEWMDLWDKALEYGTLGNTIAQTIFKILSTPIFGDKSCSYCNNVISESSFLDHMVLYHGLDQNTLFSSIATNKAALFKPPLSKCILKLV